MIASILIADDDKDFASVLKMFFEKKGHEVRVVGEGIQAAMAAAEQRPHVLLLDVQMPGGYGTAAYEALQRDPETRDIPVVFMSGLIDEERMKDRVPPRENTRYMAKPVDLDRLYAVVLELLKAHGGYTE